MATQTSKYALISVYDKKGICDLSKHLIDAGYKIIATDGTGAKLKKQRIPFISCQKVSGNPDCFDGYMKTMSFSIEAGIIFDRAKPVHLREAKKFNVKQIDVVVCNFFPVKEIIKKSGTKDIQEICRNFDFGGPTMVRVAAQNFKNVTVIVDPRDYIEVKKAIRSSDLSSQLSNQLRHRLALKAFKYILNYDRELLKYLVNE